MKEIYLRINDRYYDRHFNVNTAAVKTETGYNLAEKESVPYHTIHYRGLFFLFDKIRDLDSENILLDYGCGKGRIVTVAAFCNFKKIIGVELSPIISIAQENLKKMKFRKTENVELIKKDARDYTIPHDVNTFFFYNPFSGSALDEVVANIRRSVSQHPRKITIIYINYDDFDRCIDQQGWIKKKFEGMLLPDDYYAVYEIC